MSDDGSSGGDDNGSSDGSDGSDNSSSSDSSNGSNGSDKHVTAVPDPPSAHRPGLHPAVDEFVLELLAKKPDERPGDAAAVRNRLIRVRREMGSAGAGSRSAPVEVTQTAVPLPRPSVSSVPSMPSTSPNPVARDAPTRFLMRPARHATRMQILGVMVLTALLVAGATALIL